MGKLYCPNCGYEYRDGFFRCSDCGAPLVIKSQMAAQSKWKGTRAEDVEFVVVLRTGRIWEVEMVANVFKEADIPCYQQLETLGGLIVAKEIPMSMGPGEWWAFYVRKDLKERAEEILAELPIEVTVNPGVWHFGPTEEGKRIFRWQAIFSLILLGASLIIFLFELFRK